MIAAPARKRVVSLFGLGLEVPDRVGMPGTSSASRREWESPPGGPVRELEFAGDRLVSVRLHDGPEASATHYERDALGRLVGMVDSRGARTSYRYDDAGRLHGARYPDDSRADWRRDGLGRLVAHRDRAGCTREFRYDDEGRLCEMTEGRGAATVWSRDGEGRVALVTDPLGTTAAVRDDAGRVTRVERTIDGVVHLAEYSYDEHGRLSGLRPPGSTSWIRYRRDGSGRLARVGVDGDRAGVSIDVDGPGGTALRFDNGVRAEYRPGPAGLEAIEVLGPDGSPVAPCLTYAHDERGRITRAGEESYSYDSLGRLCAAAGPGGRVTRYEYGPTGDRLAEHRDGLRLGSEYDAAGRLVRTAGPGEGEVRYAYDAAGRLARRDGGAAAVRYEYDASGRLARVVRGGRAVAEYAYGVDGRLARRRCGDEVTVYHYDPAGRLLAETDRDGRARMTYVRVGWTDLVRVRGPLERGEVLYAHTDHLGSIRALTDVVGRTAWTGGCEPFGAPRGESPPGGHQFMGHARDEATGLYDFGARWYDAETGRFLTPDACTCGPDDLRLSRPGPPGDDDSRVLESWLRRPEWRHAYALCGNNPVCAIDPDGNWSFGWILLNVVVGSLWTLPWTILGIAVAVVNVVAQVFRPLVGLFANVSGWQGLAFDAAACSRLNTYGVFYGGGLLGNVLGALSIGALTMGNSIWIQESLIGNRALYNHELRHTNQYEWLGPFFHVGLPLWGVYIWDTLIHGYFNSFLETDARTFETPTACI